ncbi:MAG: acetyltransferase [Alistipes sp.]|nr:acetyltransferase [Alistipes sp.]
MYLYGASGHAKVIIDILKSQDIEIKGCIDDNPARSELSGYPVLHNAEGLSPIIISIGDNNTRKRIAEKLTDCTFGTAIHSSAIISSSAQIGVGSVVMQGAIIQADARVGQHCIINTAATIDHECIIEDYVHISPHTTLCGNVHIGKGSWIGAGAVIIPGVKIGKWCTIGAGSVVRHNLPDGVTAYGNNLYIKDKNCTMTESPTNQNIVEG